MPAQKKAPPCSGYEFGIRRQAAGLDNATFRELTGFSLSALTKWNAGQLPVSRKAYRKLEEIEIAIENEVQRLVDEYEIRMEGDRKPEELQAFNPQWKFGDAPYAVAVSRARRIIADGMGLDLRITPPPGKIDPQSAPPYAAGVPRDE